MEILTTLEAVGSLWLPWYVRRDDAAVLIRSIQLEHQQACALQVREVSEDFVVRNALELKTAHGPRGPWSHVERITHLRDCLEIDHPIGPFPAWSTDEGLILRDGCHRSCALYELGSNAFELHLDVTRAPADAVETRASLRARNLL